MRVSAAFEPMIDLLTTLCVPLAGFTGVRRE